MDTPPEMPETEHDRHEARAMRVALGLHNDAQDGKANRINRAFAILYKAAESDVSFALVTYHNAVVNKIHEMAGVVDREWVAPLMNFFHERHVALCRSWSANGGAAP